MTFRCPIPHCPFPVPGPLRICSSHYKLVPRPQQDALNHYAKKHKGGPAHVASFKRAVESVEKILAFHDQMVRQTPASLPYRDD